jgi:cell division protein FtsB
MTQRSSPTRSRPVRLARRLGLLGGTAGFAALLAIGVFPTRTWLDQRASTAEAESSLHILREQNEALEDRIARLEDDSEIERLAREQYNLVLPGEEAYVVLPPPLPPLDLPPIWPFGPLLDDPGADLPPILP